jgi:formiminotetrahydrofolate cyclodeaminase
MRRGLLSLPLDEYLDELAGESRVPGAGPAAALTTAAAAALVAMVARRSREWSEAAASVAQAETLRRRAERLARDDAEALELFLAAREGGDRRRETRDFHLGRALDHAADVPLAIGETSCDVALLAEHVAEHGDPEVRAEAAVAALLAHAASRAALHLVEVNLAAGPDDERVLRAARLVAAAGDAAARAARVGD